MTDHDRAETSALALLGNIIDAAYEDFTREGTKETPARMAKALRELTDGYHQDPKEFLKIFDDPHADEIVVAKGMDFSSLCEHHVLPFTGKVDVAYIPSGRIIGLSKIPRIVRCLSRRLQVQERLTREIADALKPLEPQGVSVRISAVHMCASLRGIETPTQMVTHCTRGLFRADPRARAELMELYKVQP